MRYPDPNLHQFITHRNFTSYLVLFGFAILGLFLAQFFSYIVTLFFTDFDPTAATQFYVNQQRNEADRVPLLLVQAVNSLVLFVVAPLLYVRFFEKGKLAAIPGRQPRQFWLALTLTALVIVLYMPVSAWAVQWNERFVFPEGWAALEKQVRDMEDLLKELTVFLINFQSPFEFILGLLVVAVVPGIGEELLFRGVLQNKIAKSTGSIHVAIWVSALIFSAIHFQFYGFLPRMLLGALFGYLYVWSGSLLVPMFAHFLNNGFTLVWMYLYNKGIHQVDVDAVEEISIFWVIGSLSAVGILGVYLVQLCRPGPNEPVLDLRATSPSAGLHGQELPREEENTESHDNQPDRF